MDKSTSDSMYRTLYEHSLDAVILQSLDGQIFAANPAACDMFQRTEDEICKLGRSCLVDESSEDFRAALAERERTGKAKSEMQLLRSDGNQFYGEVGSAQFINGDGEARVVLIIHDITHRKQIEHSLRESEKRYRSVVTSMGEGVVFQQADGCIIAVNPAAEKILGRTAEDLLGMTSADDSWDAIHEDGSPFPAPEHPITLALSHGRTQRDVVMGIQVNDKLRWLSINADPVFDEESDRSKPKAAVATFQDITDRKRANEALLDSEQRYRMIFESSPLGMFRSTVAGKYVEVNQSMANMLGYATPAALVESIHDIGKEIYLNAQDRCDVVDRQFQSSEGVVHHPFNRYRRRDGRVILTNLYLKTIRDEHGNPILFDGIVEDITQAKLAEDELRASEARFRSFSDHAMDAFFLHGEKGIVLDANRQACLSLGYGRDEIIGMSPSQFDAEKSQEFRDDFRARVDKGEIVTFETHHRRKDGSIFPVEVRIRPFNSGGQMRYISTARDISERERTEDELRMLNRELLAIGHCHQALLRNEEELSLLDEICHIICEEAGYVMAWVGFVKHDKEKTVIPVAWAGNEDDYIEEAKLSWSEDSLFGNGPTGKAIRSGEILYIQDIATDPCMEPWRKAALDRGFRSSAVFPLKNDSTKVFGALCTYSSEPNAMTCAELRLLGELADDLAFGIRVSRMRAATIKAEKSLRDKKVELEKSNEQLRQLAARREETIEKEKTEIARNVHDELAQLLTALKMRLSMLGVEYGKENELLKQDIEYVEDLSDKAMVAARDVISALRPPSLDMGLAVSLEWLAQQYTKNTGIDCSVKFGNCEDCRDEATKKSVCTTMYRIAQEGLTNIARYAQANQVDICMSDSDGVCQMTIRDNGIGFDPKRVKENSFGLIGIRERAEILGGTFAIDSEEGHGTEILVRIPQPAKSAEPA